MNGVSDTKFSPDATLSRAMLVTILYRMEKELYLLEFEDSTGATVDDQATIQVGYHSEEYGGECDYTYQPNVLLSADSQDIYQSGPEAVVEQYLKNFPDAVTRNDFSLIRTI